MSSKQVVSKTQNNNYVGDEDEDEDQDQQLETTSHDQKAAARVTSHLYLKPAHSSQALDKEVVLQRIRQRKRANKLRAAFQDLIRLPNKPNRSNDKKVSFPQKRWVDDAFAAL